MERSDGGGNDRRWGTDGTGMQVVVAMVVTGSEVMEVIVVYV